MADFEGSTLPLLGHSRHGGTCGMASSRSKMTDAVEKCPSANHLLCGERFQLVSSWVLSGGTSP